MKKICVKEDVDIDVESLGLIGREANGSMRDGLSLLDQVMSCTQGAIEHDQILDILGVIDRDIIFKISSAVIQGDITEILDILDEVYSAGHDMKKLYTDLIEHFRNLLIVKMGKKTRKLVDIPAHEIDLMLDQTKNVPKTFLNQLFDLLFKEEPIIEHSSRSKLAIEMVFIRMFQIKPALPIDVLIEKLDHLQKKFDESLENFIGTANRSSQPTSGSVTGTAESTETFVSCHIAPVDHDEILENKWEKLLSIFLEKHPSLATNLKNSKIKGLTDNQLEIEVNGNDFNINMVRKEKNVGIIKKVCRDFFGKEIGVIIRTKKITEDKHHQKNSRKVRLKQEALSHPLVTDALEIFNGKIVDVKIL
jgi:DNA polymerase-3 subunit gamma/tau